MLKSKSVLFAFGMIAATIAMPAHAQSGGAEPLQMEAGAIEPGADSATTIVDASGAVALAIDVMPIGTEWDPIITVTEAVTGELLGEDDDGGNGLASRLVIPASFSGLVEVEVRNVSGVSEGAPMRYLVMVSETVVPEIETRAIALGDTLEGNIAAGSEAFFAFSAEEGQVLQFAVSAADAAWDTYAEVFAGGTVGVSEAIAVNDDRGGGSLDSFLTFIAPAAGDYVLRVSEIGETGGDYTVSMTKGPDISGAEAFGPIGLGEARRLVIMSGATDHPMIALDSAAKAALARGGTAVITLTGTREETDPTLEAGFATPLGFASVAQDDDGGENLNSRLVLDLSRASDATWLDALRIKVSTINEGASEVTLTVELGD